MFLFISFDKLIVYDFYEHKMKIKLFLEKNNLKLLSKYNFRLLKY